MNLTPTRASAGSTGKVHWTGTDTGMGPDRTWCGQRVVSAADGQEVTCRRCLDYADAAKNIKPSASTIEAIARVIAERIGVDTDLGDDTTITATLDGASIGIKYALHGVVHRVVLEIADPRPFSRFETATIDARARVAAAADKKTAIRDEIHARIADGTWLPGDRIPSITTIVDRLGVPRSAAYQAIKMLEAEGQVFTLKGGPGVSGTFVTGAEADTLTRHQEILESLLKDIQSGRFKPGTVLPTMAALAEAYDAHRTTVGKVFTVLEAGGLIGPVPQTGPNRNRRLVADPLPAKYRQ